MVVSCDVLEQFNNNVLITLEDNNSILLQFQCEQINFCENLPTMMQQILQKLKNKSFSTKIKFDIQKHLTTYRIFNSFISGLMM